jgi:hypothetical protein
MGCDIHAYVEIKTKGKWHYGGVAPIGRRYGVFGAMTNGQVRGDDAGLGFDPKGLPEDVSEVVKESSDRWDTDVHSHSYLTSAELMKLKDKFDEWSKSPTEPGYEKFKEQDDWYEKEFSLIDRHFPLMCWGRYRNPAHNPKYYSSPFIEDVRLVFWFDN